MAKQVFVFLVFFLVIFFSLKAYKQVELKERMELFKIAGKSIMISLAVVAMLSLLVILF